MMIVYTKPTKTSARKKNLIQYNYAKL